MSIHLFQIGQSIAFRNRFEPHRNILPLSELTILAEINKLLSEVGSEVASVDWVPSRSTSERREGVGIASRVPDQCDLLAEESVLDSSLGRAEVFNNALAILLHRQPS